MCMMQEVRALIMRNIERYVERDDPLRHPTFDVCRSVDDVNCDAYAYALRTYAPMPRTR